MAVTKVLYGITRYIPESKERNWGVEMTVWAGDVTDGLNGVTTLEAGVARVKLSVTDTLLGAGATLTPTHNVHRVAGNGGAVTLGGVTAIANGTSAEQLLVVRGTSNVNTVTIPATSNVEMNGPITLLDGTQIVFGWDATAVQWREIARNN